ncbi:hypothetical protein [Geobacter sp. SVR]|uniref:hypothetical protein n=1 Tax=Geobacter sp. SVR TaxID=2495594 RepID=UPI00143EF740|nr:hypothetical protein [Geobacter sp. SVR]BCS53187.1 hypothetical protein GSVR_14950 [Geobacter sp. SVR]GCF84572.1 hypothetical protein GSbR_11720 [Geobacter sp. SVR]
MEHEKAEHAEKKGEKERYPGLFVGKRNLWLLAGGAVGALAALSLEKLSPKVRPTAVGVVKEGYAFKEWIAAKAERVKEDVEDIVAEGIHNYHSDLEASADAVRREKEILDRIGKCVDERRAKMSRDKGEA